MVARGRGLLGGRGRGTRGAAGRALSNRARRLLLAAILVLATAALAGPALAAPGAADPAITRQLAAVRQAPAEYHDPAATLAVGYLATTDCAASPAGGMGLHYVNPGRLVRLDPARPNILRYAPGAAWPRLADVEYFAPVLYTRPDGGSQPWFDRTGPPPAGWVPTPASALFGQRFDGPMPGHEVGMPWHDDLHVWLWQATRRACSPRGTRTSAAGSRTPTEDRERAARSRPPVGGQGTSGGRSVLTGPVAPRAARLQGPPRWRGSPGAATPVPSVSGLERRGGERDGCRSPPQPQRAARAIGDGCVRNGTTKTANGQRGRPEPRRVVVQAAISAAMTAA